MLPPEELGIGCRLLAFLLGAYLFLELYDFGLGTWLAWFGPAPLAHWELLG